MDYSYFKQTITIDKVIVSVLLMRFKSTLIHIFVFANTPLESKWINYTKPRYAAKILLIGCNELGNAVVKEC